jgi:hypothetical protein
MKIYWKPLVSISLLACLCACQTRTLNPEKKTDSDLDLLVFQNRSFQDVLHSLRLEHTGYHIVENGSLESITYRFSIGDRYLFLEVNQSKNLVTNAFFADKSQAKPLINEISTNGVVKPKGG